jgi:hypothetical protein
MVLSPSEKKAATAFAAASLSAGGTINTHVNIYDVQPGQSPVFINYTAGIGRTVVKFDTGGTGIGKIPYAVVLAYNVFGRPTGVIRMGIRKASDDLSFVLIAEHPIDDFIDEPSGLHVVTIQGYSDYAMVANDKISIEYPSNTLDGLAIASTGANTVPGFTSQSHNGSTYSNTANALALTIRARVAS